MASMAEGNWDYSSLWAETIRHIQRSISEQEFVMWFKNLRFAGSEQENIILNVPSSFYKDQIIKRYQSEIEETLHELQGNPIKIRFVVEHMGQPGSDASNPGSPAASASADDNGSSPSGASVSLSSSESAGAPRAGVVEPSSNTSTSKARSLGSGATAAPKGQADVRSGRSLDVPSHPQLKSEYSFENFVIGENNSFAANAAIAISRNPGTAYNPCLIYGGVGLGKTHLIQAIGDALYRTTPRMKIVYVPAETFTSEFISSIQSGTSHQFKKKYRSVDILLIDDIHFLQGKIQTQEELFYTFEALYNSNKQMVFTCDRPVSELKELTDRLRSRFERGLNVDLQPPNYETRVAILRKKTENNNVPISEEAIELIARNITTNVRDLEAALMKLIAYADLVNKNITLEVARTQLRDFFTNSNQRNITMDIILRSVAEFFGLSQNDLRGKKRTKAIAFPRQIAMYLAREMTEYSTTEVGIEFGGRDHTTVMYACQKIENAMKTDSTMEPMIQSIKRKIKEHRISS